MNTEFDPARLKLLKNAAVGLALIPVAASLLRSARAADLPSLSLDDPTAKAMKYVNDAAKASGTKPGSHCGNCMLYQGGAGSAQGGCAVFPGKSVKAAGWCASWAAKA